jgi:hypothetical protein
MKTRASFLPLLLAVIFCAAVHSQAAGLIGQTYDKCVAQFGEPKKHLETGALVSDLWTFEQGDWSIEVGLVKGVVQMVSYQRADGKPLEPAQIQALLAGFGDRLAWTVDTTGRYRRSDHLMEAKATDRGLTFLTTALAHAL